MGKIRHRLYHCIVCGEEKTRKKITAGGRAKSICKECYELPKGVRSEALRVDKLHWLITKYPKSREDWVLIEKYAANHKDKESGQIAQSYLEECSPHYKAKIAVKEQRINRHQYYINRKAMKDLLEQIEVAYTSFKENADSQIAKGNKSAGVRSRKHSLELEKLLKEFRKTSLKTSKV